MKKQKILIDVQQSMRESLFGSTQRNDELGRLYSKWRISDAKLRKICLAGGGKTNYWVH